MLQERGVKNVRALLGGWNEWVSSGNPVDKGAQPSASIHPIHSR